VDQLAQEKIYHLLTNAIPLPNLKLITEPYRFEDKQNKLTGLFLDKDTDYRTLLADVEEQYSEESGSIAPENLAEEIAVNYFYLVFKALLADLRDCYGFDPAYFSLENLIK
jgi:hypothetical protein